MYRETRYVGDFPSKAVITEICTNILKQTDRIAHPQDSKDLN